MGVTLIHLAPTTETTNDNAHHMFTVRFVQNKNTLYNKGDILKTHLQFALEEDAF